MIRAIAIVACASVLAPALTNAQSAITPEQRMQSRFPQPVRVGDLIGYPLLDDQARTLGHIRAVVRTGDGKIKLIVDYGGLFGISWASHPVAVPLEVIGIAGRHVSSLDMSDAEFAAAPTWRDATAQTLPDETVIRIALARH